MSPGELAMDIQIAQGPVSDDEIVECKPVYVLDTVNNLGLRYCRSCTDNRRHGEQFVLLIDHNSFALDGCFAVEILPDLRELPIYRDDHEAACDWTGPAQKLVDRELSLNDLTAQAQDLNMGY